MNNKVSIERTVKDPQKIIKIKTNGGKFIKICKINENIHKIFVKFILGSSSRGGQGNLKYPFKILFKEYKASIMTNHCINGFYLFL